MLFYWKDDTNHGYSHQIAVVFVFFGLFWDLTPNGGPYHQTGFAGQLLFPKGQEAFLEVGIWGSGRLPGLMMNN